MNFLQNLTIKRRLQFNALIVGLAMIVMLCIIIYEARIMLKLNETIQYAEELDVHELSMRKYEKDFLFYKDESSLELFAQEYKKLQKQYKLLKLNFWTTVSCLNVGDLPNIIEYAKNKNIPHAWAFLNTPNALNVKYKNNLTIGAEHIAPDKIAIAEDNSNQLELFIKRQDYIRKININYYLSF